MGIALSNRTTLPYLKKYMLISSLKGNVKNYFYHTFRGEEPKPSTLERKDKEHFEPCKSKGFGNLVIAKDLFENPSGESAKRFDKKWTSTFFYGEDDKTIKSLYSSLLANGYNEQSADLIVKNSYANSKRATRWSLANIKYGHIASTSTTITIILSFLKELFDWDSGDNKLFKNIINLTCGMSRGIRSFCQYHLYSRSDDDAAMNQYQADVYGNVIAGELSKVSTFTERYINSWAYGVIELFPKNIKSAFKSLLSLPTSMWWRARMPAHINQEFFTDFLKYLYCKPLSWFRNKWSIEELKKITERGNIDPSYVLERHCKNAGLADKKDWNISKLFSKITAHIKNMVNKNPDVQLDSSKKLGETIAPALGMFGFFSVALGNMGSGLLRLVGFDGKALKWFDFLSASAFASQQAIYLPKIAVPLYAEGKQIEEALSNPKTKNEYSKEEIKNFSKLAMSKKFYSFFSIGSFILNLINTPLKLFNFENNFFQKFKNIVDDLSGNLSNKFFSHRRYLMGLQFKLENPEFFT